MAYVSRCVLLTKPNVFHMNFSVITSIEKKHTTCNFGVLDCNYLQASFNVQSTVLHTLQETAPPIFFHVLLVTCVLIS